MKILLYNWIQFDDKNGRGGGVTVYLNNLIHEIIEEGKDQIELFFLSSGSHYDIYNGETRYEELSNRYGEKCRCFSIINSPVFSPAFLSFYYLDQVIYDEVLKRVFSDFLTEYGPFDVVHFHNFEGLSMNVLDCGQEYPDTKFVYTLHNYYPFCPQVNLWREEQNNCDLRDTGKECIKCMSDHVPADKLRHKMAMTYRLLKNPSERLARAYRYCGQQLDQYYKEMEGRELTQEDCARLEKSLSEYRKRFTLKMNANMDVVLAVSRRVYEIAVRMGLQERLIKVSYIGTRAAEEALNHANCSCNEESLSLIYMGYQRIDKGYYFLADVLNRIPENISKKIDMVLVAKKFPNSIYKDVEIEKGKFHSFISKNGYSREEMPSLLAGKHLGIIPVLWEDNLPQVAIEMTAYGVPILTSDLGGASELCDDDQFIFRAGDTEDCIEKIANFVNHQEKLDDYWTHYRGLKTMKDHLKELMGYWN